jgi:hypothetical protein
VVPELIGSYINRSSVLEKTRLTDESIGGLSNTKRTAERHDGVRKSIYGISVVERLGTEGLEENRRALKRATVINVRIRMYNPDKLLTRVVEVKLNLIRRRTNRLITSELELLDEVLVRVLRHTTALISVKEHVVNVE